MVKAPSLDSNRVILNDVCEQSNPLITNSLLAIVNVTNWSFSYLQRESLNRDSLLESILESL